MVCYRAYDIDESIAINTAPIMTVGLQTHTLSFFLSWGVAVFRYYEAIKLEYILYTGLCLEWWSPRQVTPFQCRLGYFNSPGIDTTNGPTDSF